MISAELYSDLVRLKQFGTKLFVVSPKLSLDEKLYLEVESLIRDDRYGDWELIKESFESDFYRDFSSCYYYLFINPKIALDFSQKLLANYNLSTEVKTRVLFWEMDSYFLSGDISRGIEKMSQIPGPDSSHPVWKAEALSILALNYYFINDLDRALKYHLDCHTELKVQNDSFLEIFNSSMALRVALKKCDSVSFDFFSEVLSSQVSKTLEKRYSLRISGYKALIYDQLGDHVTAEKYWDLADQIVNQVSMKWEIGQYYLLKGIGKILSGEETSSLIFLDKAETLLKGSGSPLIYIAELELIKVLRPWATEKYLARGLNYVAEDSKRALESLITTSKDKSFESVLNYFTEGISFITTFLNGGSNPKTHHSLVVSILCNASRVTNLQTSLRGKKKVFHFLSRLSELKSLKPTELIRAYEESFEVQSVFNDKFIVSPEYIHKDEYVEQSHVVRLVNNLIKLSETSQGVDTITAIQLLSHDIKNQSILAQELFKNSQPEQGMRALEQIIEICDSELRGQKESFDIKQLITKISRLFGDKLDVMCSNNFPVSSIPFNSLERIVFNLIQNSFDANATKVSLELVPDVFSFTLIIKDNGKGISEEVLSNLDRGGVTTKKNGHGIGLSSSRNKILEIEGDLHIVSELSGTTIELRIPYFPIKKERHVVVLDDDKYQKIIWCKRLGIERLKFFSSEVELLNSISTLSKDSLFFIDKNIPGSDGVKILENLKRKGFDYLFLNTSEEVSLQDTPFILKNISKVIPF